MQMYAFPDRYEPERISTPESQSHGGRLFMSATEERVGPGRLDAEAAQSALAEEKACLFTRPRRSRAIDRSGSGWRSRIPFVFSPPSGSPIC